jgi:Domain of unknown function (DUF1905)
MKFKTTLLQGESKNVTGIVVPPEIIANLRGGYRPPVKVTINGYSYRNTVGVMSGKFMVGVSSEHRAKANVKGATPLMSRSDLILPHVRSLSQLILLRP